MSFAANIKKLRKSQGLNQLQLADKIKISRATVINWEKGKTRPERDELQKLSKQFDINIDDLLDEAETSKENRTLEQTGKIPFYDTVAIGGLSLVADQTPVYEKNYEMIQPGAFLGKANGALRVYGDSMYGKYPSGCIIGFKEAKDWQMLIHYGQDYVIEFEDQRIVKNVQPSDKPGHILAVSYNSFVNKHGIDIYRPYDIPLSSIRKMHYVLGVVKFEASI
jgi:transcriptional regulator with XRE-family HTH domain